MRRRATIVLFMGIGIIPTSIVLLRSKWSLIKSQSCKSKMMFQWTPMLLRIMFWIISEGHKYCNPNILMYEVIPNVVTEKDNNFFTSIPLAEEVKIAVFDLNVDGAPGPDGFRGHFYQFFGTLLLLMFSSRSKSFFVWDLFFRLLIQILLCWFRRWRQCPPWMINGQLLWLTFNSKLSLKYWLTY